MTLQLAPDRQGSVMADEYENDEARLEAARGAVERWETEGGARESEQSAERTSEAIPDSQPTIPRGEPGEATHDRGRATERETMKSTTIRGMQLRDLAHRVARVRLAVAQQTVERESAIRRHGGAHPRTIRASRRLVRTMGAYRHLDALYRRRAREDVRHKQ
jgi:hypothetical protein